MRVRAVGVVGLALLLGTAAWPQDEDLDQLLNTCLTARGQEYVAARDRFLAQGPEALALLKAKWEQSVEHPDIVLEAMYLRARYPDGARNYEQWFQEVSSKLSSSDPIDMNLIEAHLDIHFPKAGWVSGQIGFLEEQFSETRRSKDGNFLKPATLLAESLFRENQPLAPSATLALAMGLARESECLAERPTYTESFVEKQRFERAMLSLWRELVSHTDTCIRAPAFFGINPSASVTGRDLSDVFLNGLHDRDPVIRYAAACNFYASDIYKDDPALLKWAAAQIEQWWLGERDPKVRRYGPKCIMGMLWQHGIPLLKRIAAEDMDPKIRQEAEYQLSRLVGENRNPSASGTQPPHESGKEVAENIPPEPIPSPDTGTGFSGTPGPNSQPPQPARHQAPAGKDVKAVRAAIVAGAIAILAGITILFLRRSKARL